MSQYRAQQAQRSALATRAAIASVAVALLLLVLKAWAAVSTGSMAMLGSLADTGLDVDIHVDGASGAFLAPFCAPDVVWDFRLPRVKSISTSGHKFGLAPLGAFLAVADRVDAPPEDPVERRLAAAADFLRLRDFSPMQALELRLEAARAAGPRR